MVFTHILIKFFERIFKDHIKSPYIFNTIMERDRIPNKKSRKNTLYEG